MTEQEFHNKIEEWISQDISRWNHITLLAYFCWKYEKANGIPFRLVRAKKGPTMGKEARDFSRLFERLAPEDYKSLGKEEKKAVKIETNVKIKNFINWVFDYKFRGKASSVNGTGFFLLYNLINEFERMYNLQLKKISNKQKLEELFKWCRENNSAVLGKFEIESVDDIKIVCKYAEQYSLGEDSHEVKFIVQAKKLELV